MSLPALSIDGDLQIITDVHRGLLQVLMHRNVLSSEEAIKVVNVLKSQFKAPAALDARRVMDDLVPALDKLKFGIVSLRNDFDDGRVYHVFVNQDSDLISKEATPLEDWEIDVMRTFLNTVLDRATCPTGALSFNEMMTAYNKQPAPAVDAEGKHAAGDAAPTAKKRTSQVETCVEKLLSQYWLHQDEDSSKYYLGVRSLAEFASMIDSRSDAVHCPVCRLVVLGGVTTEDGQQAHRFCIARRDALLAAGQGGVGAGAAAAAPEPAAEDSPPPAKARRGRRGRRVVD